MTPVCSSQNVCCIMTLECCSRNEHAHPTQRVLYYICCTANEHARDTCCDRCDGGCPGWRVLLPQGQATQGRQRALCGHVVMRCAERWAGSEAQEGEVAVPEHGSTHQWGGSSWEGSLGGTCIDTDCPLDTGTSQSTVCSTCLPCGLMVTMCVFGLWSRLWSSKKLLHVCTACHAWDAISILHANAPQSYCNCNSNTPAQGDALLFWSMRPDMVTTDSAAKHMVCPLSCKPGAGNGPEEVPECEVMFATKVSVSGWELGQGHRSWK